MPSMSEYYSVIEDSIKKLEQIYVLVDTERLKVMNPELDENQNWYDTLWNIQNSINQQQLMLAVHKFERISKEKMQALFTHSTVGESTGKSVKSVVHIKRDFDTLRILENQYGVAWQDILKFNSMTSADFENAKTILIPIPVDIENNANKDIPVFGDQEGLKILGTDLPIELIADDSGDLLVLNEQDSFAQLIKTISETEKGDFPFYENFGLQLQVGEQVPAEAVESMMQIKIFDGFKQDPRIKEVEIQSITQSNTSRNATVIIHPVVGEAIKAQV
jgi:hypothetical protein